MEQPSEDSMKKVEEAMKRFPLMPFMFERDSRKAMNACSFGIVASSKSGKTTFLKYLLKKHFAEDIKLFMTQSPQADIYNTLKKEVAFAPAFIPDMIKTCYMINKNTKNHYPFCVIVDDVVGAKNNIQMNKLLCLYRNSRMSAIVVGQDLKMLNPTGRANVNYLLLGWQNTDNRVEDNIKEFLRSYFPKNLSMDEKILLYRKLTADHCFLFINSLEDTICRVKLQSSQIVE